jgi:outer membrane lipoprotein SlyB
MKTTMLALLAAAMALPAQAQLFSNEALGGALLGGIAGGVIGHNHHRQTAEGIAIGAGSGLILGGLFGQGRRNHDYYNTQVPVPHYQPAPRYGYHGDPYYSPTYHGYGHMPSYRHRSIFAPSQHRPNYALTGAALGALGGAVIGHNHHRQTAEGAGIGAAAGLLLGTIAERNARQREAIYAPPAYVAPASGSYFTPTFQTAAPVQTQQPAAQNITIINNYYGNSSPMSGANSLFGR